jgi:hypothetical protein
MGNVGRVPVLELVDSDGGGVMLSFDGTVVELFHTSYDKSFRVPAAWLAIRREDRKHDRVRLTVGRTRRREQPVYDAQPDDWTYVSFEIEATAEPPVRALLAEVAAAAGRG